LQGNEHCCSSKNNFAHAFHHLLLLVAVPVVWPRLLRKVVVPLLNFPAPATSTKQAMIKAANEYRIIFITPQRVRQNLTP
jgi:hypothetical protein